MDNNETNNLNWTKNILNYLFGYFKSNSDNKVYSNLDWSNVFILESFQDNFSMKELQGLSMLSRNTRSKLNPILFKSIQLLYHIKRDFCGGRMRAFNIRSFEEINMTIISNMNEINKNMNIKRSLRMISSELQDIKYFVNSIYIFNVKRSGLYLYPVLSNFINLSVLKIHYSTIQYSIFLNLGEYFPMLEAFELNRVALSKEPTDSDNLNEINFPANLKKLSIWSVEVTNISILAEPYEIVFNNHGALTRSKFSLPNIHLPSLKNLQLLRCSVKKNGLEKFLKTNTNLEQLIIDTFSPKLSKYFNSLKNLDIHQAYDIKNLKNLTTNQNIKRLKIEIRYNRFYENFEKLCLMCPSVEYLQLDVRCANSCQDAINNYLAPILKKLPKLKTIELPLYLKGSICIDDNDLPKLRR